jgi:hypothetical protein
VSSIAQWRCFRRLMERFSEFVITRQSDNKFLTRKEMSESDPRLFVQICWVTSRGCRKLPTWPVAIRTWVICFDNYQIKQPLQKKSHKLTIFLSPYQHFFPNLQFTPTTKTEVRVYKTQPECHTKHILIILSLKFFKTNTFTFNFYLTENTNVSHLQGSVDFFAWSRCVVVYSEKHTEHINKVCEGPRRVFWCSSWWYTPVFKQLLTFSYGKKLVVHPCV